MKTFGRTDNINVTKDDNGDVRIVIEGSSEDVSGIISSEAAKDLELELPERVKHRNTVQMQMPIWMLKQLRGYALHNKKQSITGSGANSADQMIDLLTYYHDQVK